MEINQRLFETLKLNDLKEADLAKVLNVGTGQISTWKSRKSDPPAKYITKIC